MLDRWFKRYKYQNTRQYMRLPAAWPIKCEPKTPADASHVTATRDVSAGGFCVVTREMIPVGSRIRVEIHVPPLDRSIQAEGQVVRCLPAHRGSFQLGIRFLEIDPKERVALNEAIEKSAGSRVRAHQERSWWRKLP